MPPSGWRRGRQWVRREAPMTEAQWLACEDPMAMLGFLRGKASDRKLRLFAVRCCRRITHLLDPRGLTALTIAERFADGLASEEQLRGAEGLAEDAFNEFDHAKEYAAEAVMAACDREALEGSTWRAAYIAIHLRLYRPLLAGTNRLTQRKGCGWLRDMFNPYRPSALAPASLIPTVTWLAEGIYEDRGFDRLPILGDALEEAGCTDHDLLGHLRSPGPHVRGCWALDLVLGKG